MSLASHTRTRAPITALEASKTGRFRRVLAQPRQFTDPSTFGRFPRDAGTGRAARTRASDPAPGLSAGALVGFVSAVVHPAENLKSEVRTLAEVLDSSRAVRPPAPSRMAFGLVASSASEGAPWDDRAAWTEPFRGHGFEAPPLPDRCRPGLRRRRCRRLRSAGDPRLIREDHDARSDCDPARAGPPRIRGCRPGCAVGRAERRRRSAPTPRPRHEGSGAVRLPGWGGLSPGTRRRRPADRLGPAQSGLAELAVLDWRSGAVLGRRWFDPPVDQTVLRGSDLWALEARPGALLRVDSRTLEPTSAPLPLTPGRTLALASGAGYLWVTAADAGEVLRIDPATHASNGFTSAGSRSESSSPAEACGSPTTTAARSSGSTRARSSRWASRSMSAGSRVGWRRPPARSSSRTRNDGTVVRIDAHSGKRIGLPIRIAPPTKDVSAPAVARAGQSVWVSSFASNTLNRIDSTVGRRGGEIKVLIAHDNDRHQGDAVTNGGLAGIGVFTASGAVSDKGKAAVYRTKKLL